MRNRLILAGLAATGGLFTTAFLQTAVAVADVSADGADAFTIGSYTFDPTLAAGGEGFDPVPPLVGAPPLLEIGGGTPLGVLTIAPQGFEVFDPTGGADLGSIHTGETVTDLFGLINSEFTVEDVTPVDGGSASDLPAVGSVYDALNLGNGYENIYTAIPSATPGGPDTVSDIFVTPNGDINLDSLFGSIDAAAPLNPGDAFTGLEAGDSSIGADAFSIGGFTFDPTLSAGGEGFDTIPALTASPPLLDIGGGTLEGLFFNSQNLNVYTGTGSAATEVGSINTGENVTNLLGFTNTELVVQSATPTGDATAADLPTAGSVYDAFNFGNGYENVYTDIVSSTGGANTVSDELVTPFGNINLDSLFGGVDAASPLAPGDAFTGLQAGDSGIGADAFTIDGTTFDPQLAAGGEGFDPVVQLTAAPPLLQIGGGALNLGPGFGSVPLADQDFNVYDGTGTEIGNVDTSEAVTNLLGLTNTEFTVDTVTGTSADLPTVGSVFDVFNLGGGFENIYTAIPGVAGAADTVTDTFVTPFGNIDLGSLFGGIDYAAGLNPGDAFGGGLDVATAAASEAASAIDPLSFLGL